LVAQSPLKVELRRTYYFRAWKVVLSMLSVISVVDDDAVRTFASAEEFVQSPDLHNCVCVVRVPRRPRLTASRQLCSVPAADRVDDGRFFDRWLEALPALQTEVQAVLNQYGVRQNLCSIELFV
jgi:hypothetical protein